MAEVAIITSMYNAESTIVGTIESVLNQSFEDWEWFIMDDGSSDASQELVLSHTSNDPRIQYRDCGRVGHIGVLRNRGSHLTQAPFLNFLDADDQFLPTFLEKQLHLIKSTDSAVVHTHANFLLDGVIEKAPLRYYGPGVCPPPRLFEYLKHRNTIISPTVVINSEIFHHYGEFSEHHDHFSNLDGNLWLRMAAKEVFSFQSEPLLNYCLRSGSLSRSISNAKRNSRGDLLSLHEALKENHRLAPEILGPIRYRLGKEYAIFAKILMSERYQDPEEVEKMIRESVRYGYRWTPFLIYQLLNLLGPSFACGYHQLKSQIRDVFFKKASG